MRDEFLVERQGKTFALYAGLLDEAHQQGLKGIRTILVQLPAPENGQTAIVHATIETAKGLFDGIGDANPGNVARPMVGAIIRLAETRAKARALRDAINVGVTALEEVEEEDEEPKATSPGRPIKPATVGPQPAQLNQLEHHRVRLGWTGQRLVAWVRSRSDGRGPRELTAEEAGDALNALANIPTPTQPSPA